MSAKMLVAPARSIIWPMKVFGPAVISGSSATSQNTRGRRSAGTVATFAVTAATRCRIMGMAGDGADLRDVGIHIFKAGSIEHQHRNMELFQRFDHRALTLRTA